MRITKYAHACLLIEEGEARIITDPGEWSEIEGAGKVDAVLVTHEHKDHLSVANLRVLLAANPAAEVITHEAVGKLLAAEGIAHRTVHDKDELVVQGVTIRVFASRHAYIYGELPQCDNAGYLIADRFFYPGDALHQPAAKVEILALPVGGPWMRLSEAIDYAKAVMPQIVVPVHDAFFVEGRAETTRLFPKKELEPLGITLEELPIGTPIDF